MSKPTEPEFIQAFAKEWNEILSKQMFKEHEIKTYIGWMNIEHMLRVFLKAYKKREKK